MPNIAELIKKAALDAVENSKPMAVVFGTVIKEAPLIISIDQKLNLSEAQLVLTNGVINHEVRLTLDGIERAYTVNNAIKVNDTVLMLRMQGGQKFVVIEKVVSP